MPRHLKVILLLGWIVHPVENWRIRDTFAREWRRAGW